MKTQNKGKVLAVTGALGIAALGITVGTISYFTDTKTQTNTFTVGDVEIELYESQLHRENSGRGGILTAIASDPTVCDWTINQIATGNTNYGNQSLISGANKTYEDARYCTPGMDAGNADGISALGNSQTNRSRQWGYSDETIIADAATYKNTEDEDGADGYFTTVSHNLVPGYWVRKFSYVKNTGVSDAYVLIRYMIPTDYADSIQVKIPGTPYEEDADSATDGTQPYFIAVTRANDTYTGYDAVSANDGIDSYTGYTETIDGTEYKVYAAVTRKALTAGEMTFWSPVNTVRIAKDATEADFEGYRAEDAINVKVEAHAIQAGTFSDAVEAINNL